jgi:hypothetical protein
MGHISVMSLNKSFAKQPLIEVCIMTPALTEPVIAIVHSRITTRSNVTSKRVDTSRAWIPSLVKVL